MQTLLGVAGLFLAGQSGTAVAHRVEPTTRAKSNPLTSQQCENALNTLIQHSSLPALRKQGLTPVLEAQDDAQATIGLFGEANWNIALGWIRIDWANSQLLDLTNDIEAPTRLTFGRKDWAQAATCLRGLSTAP